MTLRSIICPTLCAILLLASACASETYLYGEQADSLSDVAVLVGPSDVVLHEIDGQTLPQPKLGGLTPVDGWETYVQPGRHDIVIFLNSAYHDSLTTLTCNFERGKRYEVRHRIEYRSRGRATWVAEIYGC